MSVFVVGLNHRSAPLALLERVGVPEVRLEKALAELRGLEHVQEAVVVSTCNRVEVYAFAATFHGAYENVREFLAEFSYTPLGEFSQQLYSLFGADAVAHLFRVVSGLDSAVLGENEIQGQVKRAWEAAQREGAAGPGLNRLFRHALQTGKRVRSNTSVGTEKISSVCDAAVGLLQRELGDLAGRRALLLGTGEVGQTGARIFSEMNLAEVCVASRTWQRASHLAAEVGGRAVHLDELGDELASVDFLFCATGAPSVMLERSEIAAVMERRRENAEGEGAESGGLADGGLAGEGLAGEGLADGGLAGGGLAGEGLAGEGLAGGGLAGEGLTDEVPAGEGPAKSRKLVVLDLAVPRDADPAIAEIDGVRLFDITDVQSFVAEASEAAESEGSLAEMHRAQTIINEEVQNHLAADSAEAMAPLIVDFRRSICDISQSEFDKFESQLASLNPDQRESVEALVHSIVNKVLHTPTARIRESAESAESEALGEALRDLFDLQG